MLGVMTSLWKFDFWGVEGFLWVVFVYMLREDFIFVTLLFM